MPLKSRTQQEIALPQPQQDAVPKREITKASDFVSIYTNDVQIQTSPWDMRLTLSELGDMTLIGDKFTIQVRQLCDLRMSPQLAKQMALIMIEQLKVYEEQVGKIPSPNAPSPPSSQSPSASQATTPLPAPRRP
jgi:hypothetical protein